MADNPYEADGHDLAGEANMGSQSFTRRWSMYGALVAAAAPVGYGILLGFEHLRYVSALPPGTPACGTSMVGAVFLIFIVGPMLACGGGLVGGVLARIVQ